MAAEHLDVGRAGEAAAARYLQAAGFFIEARNWRKGSLELDLICRDHEFLVFVEVKTRGAGSLATPADGLSLAKRSRLARAASFYLSEWEAWDTPCRFDFVSVAKTEQGYAVEHTPNAFDLSEALSLAQGRRTWQPW